MASKTFTFSQMAANVKAVHTGVSAVGSALSNTTTISPSSVLNMVRVPNGATILDFWVRVATGGASQTIELGTSNSPSGIMSITTLSTTKSFSASISLDVLTHTTYGDNDRGYIRAPGGTRANKTAITDLMPVGISLSDDATPTSVWVQGRLTVGCSASAFFTCVLFYTMDGLVPHTKIR
jgi:hypothetical protein